MENDEKKNINLIAKGVSKGIAKSLLAFFIIPAIVGSVCYLLLGNEDNRIYLVAGITFFVLLVSVIIGTLSD